MQPMRRLLLFCTAILVLGTAPAFAAPWTQDFKMGTFIASGGSDEEGYLGLECGSLESGHPWGGEMNIRITPQAGSLPDPEVKAKSVYFQTERGDSLQLPVRREDSDFLADNDMISDTLRETLLSMLTEANGLRIKTATTPFYDIADLSLQGSATALDGFGDCLPTP